MRYLDGSGWDPYTPLGKFALAAAKKTVGGSISRGKRGVAKVQGARSLMKSFGEGVWRKYSQTKRLGRRAAGLVVGGEGRTKQVLTDEGQQEYDTIAA